jgi:hypothetical protein
MTIAGTITEVGTKFWYKSGSANPYVPYGTNGYGSGIGSISEPYSRFQWLSRCQKIYKKIILFAYYGIFCRYNYVSYLEAKFCTKQVFSVFYQQIEGSEFVRIITEPEDQRVTDPDHW